MDAMLRVSHKHMTSQSQAVLPEDVRAAARGAGRCHRSPVAGILFH